MSILDGLLHGQRQLQQQQQGSVTNPGRFSQMATYAAQERPLAFQELRDGQKKGHWIWWIFPALRDWGGDMNSALQMSGGADMANCNEALQYLAVHEFRNYYLQAVTLADAAMARHRRQ